MHDGHRPLKVAASFLILAVVAFFAEPSAAQMTSEDNAGSGISLDPERYRETVALLASDAMEGRQVGTPGGRQAIGFMEAQFRQAGLLPPEKLGGYLQRYEHDWHGKTDAANVVGFLPGTDPILREEVVIVSAHHDHLGRNVHSGCPNGRRGDRIHPGANDNASGSAALLELAFALSSRANELKRTVLFLSIDGEECGCTGAKHYVYADPIFALENTVYVLNIDQIGEGAWLEEHHQPRRVDHEADCEVDGEVFARRGIKAETLVGDNSHYHSPEDTIDHMDFQEALEVVDRALDLVWNAAQAPSAQTTETSGQPLAIDMISRRSGKVLSPAAPAHVSVSG